MEGVFNQNHIRFVAICERKHGRFEPWISCDTGKSSGSKCFSNKSQVVQTEGFRQSPALTLLDRSDHRLHGLKLRRQHHQAGMSIDRQARIPILGDDRQQPHHSITSSAWARAVGAKVMPRT